jgi:mono/diheme cytochrome c family protein
VFTLGEGRGPKYLDALADLMQRDAGKPVFVEAALSGLRDREFTFATQLLEARSWRDERPGAGRLFSALAHAIANANKDLERLLAEIADLKGRPAWIRIAILDGLAAAQKKGVTTMPDQFAALESSSDEVVRARVAALRKEWSAPVSAPRSARSLSGPVLERGKTVYAICGACHGPEGKGQVALAPPLEGSAAVSGAPDELIRGILNGRNLDRANKAFPDMPSFAALPDEDIAAVASYVRARWGGATRVVSTEQVKRLRATAPAETRSDAAGPTRE